MLARNRILEVTRGRGTEIESILVACENPMVVMSIATYWQVCDLFSCLRDVFTDEPEVIEYLSLLSSHL